MFNNKITDYIKDIEDIEEIYAKVYFKWFLIRKNDKIVLENFNIVFCKSKNSIFNFVFKRTPNPSLKIVTKNKIIKLKRKWFRYDYRAPEIIYKKSFNKNIS